MSDSSPSTELPFTEKYLGERLFHFWRHEDPDRAFQIFRSICQCGLLLSRGNKGLIDRFFARKADGEILVHEIVQNSRVCFTDIPEDKLSRHCGDYGRCGVGFSRATILEWGGAPVWYLPNHPLPGTLQGSLGEVLLGVGRTLELLSYVPEILHKCNLHMLDKKGNPYSHEAMQDQVAFMRNSILRIESFFKEMSSKEQDDHRYLYEREWRIVGGLASKSLGDPFRKLTEKEKDELIQLVPAWAEPMRSTDLRIDEQLNKEPLIDSFCFFNGIPGQRTVAQSIKMVAVPDETFAAKVRTYIMENTGLFGQEPEILILS